MVYKEHLIELWVNGFKVDLESQKSLNLRFQSIFYDPEKISSTQAEYSFEFELPSTPNNNKIFDYANNLSKLNKFHSRYNAEVYADGTLIFEGSLTLQSYKDKMYKCNLVSVKVYSLDDIFGDDTLTDIPWEIPFDGAGTTEHSIDYYNASNEDFCFPLVSYGAFQKSPYNSDNFSNDYTSKYDLDKYNRWYIESFYPSLNMLATIKKAFEYKGYTVTGNAFDDMYLKDIFMSCNLADGQSPEYNLGNPKFGTINISASLSTSGTGYQQELQFPYYKVSTLQPENGGVTKVDEYNFREIDIYDILASGVVTMNQDASYLYQPNEHIIVIPADGFYKIDLSVSSSLNTSGNISVNQFVVNMSSREMSEQNISIPVGFSENTPIEIQLVRNYNDNIELIKGKNNKKYIDGNPTHTTYTVNGVTKNNVSSWLTCFPHEDPYNAELPTEKNNLSLKNTSSQWGGQGSSGSFGGGTHSGHTRSIDTNNEREYSRSSLGYIYNDGELMCYDQAVSDTFICGFSSMNGGVASVLKNGYSWSSSNSSKNEVFNNENGYSFIKKGANNSIIYEQTTKNKNSYRNAPVSYCNVSSTSMNGSLSCMVYLYKNDVLQLYAIHRGYDSTSYTTTTNINLSLTAASPKSYANLLERNYGYDTDTDFSYNLKLTNFLNKEKKISEWVQNVIDAYNLEVIQNGKNVELNVKKKLNNGLMAVVDIDDRVNSASAEAERINYPKSMAVIYKIDTDEWGFERSVNPQSMLNTPDWKDYGDSGFTVIELNDDTYITTKSDKQLQFSYTWYDNFNWYPVNSQFVQEEGTPATITIPVISKYTYMIDGYDYEESMKHDGYGLAQRFWFRPQGTTSYVWTRTYPVERISIYEPKNLYVNDDGSYISLSYKVTEPSLLQQYFNITPYLASNYATVEVYLSPEEYKMIKNGALVRFDSDLYYPVDLSGYDPSGNNPTELKLMKKI